MKNRFAFVPKEFFDENNAAQYLPVKKSIQKRANISYQYFDYYGVVGITDTHTEAEYRANRLFTLLKYMVPNSGHTVVSYVEGRLMLVVAAKDDKLLLANIWEVDKPEDVAYYILAVIENNGMDIDRTKVKIACPQNDTVITLLNKYVSAEIFDFVLQ